jgi:hypothetical protein
MTVGASHAGHLVGEFPHEKINGDDIDRYITHGNHAAMRRLDAAGQPAESRRAVRTPVRSSFGWRRRSSHTGGGCGASIRCAGTTSVHRWCTTTSAHSLLGPP